MCTLYDIDPGTLAVLIAQASERDPCDPYRIAVEVAVEVAEARRERRRCMKEFSRELSRSLDWRRLADRRVSYDELRRRRAGDAA